LCLTWQAKYSPCDAGLKCKDSFGPKLTDSGQTYRSGPTGLAIGAKQP